MLVFGNKIIFFNHYFSLLRLINDNLFLYIVYVDLHIVLLFVFTGSTCFSILCKFFFLIAIL